MRTTAEPDPAWSAEETSGFLEQARWLLAWHNDRSEALASRATALLGFIGVILALVLTGAGLKHHRFTGFDWWMLALAAAGLLTSAAGSLATLWTKTVTMPEVTQLRTQWAAYRNDGEAKQPSFVEALLRSTNPAEDSPLDAAKNEADSRARSFKVAVTALAASLVPLAVLAAHLLHTTRGR